jgi:hypothetical protein
MDATVAREGAARAAPPAPRPPGRSLRAPRGAAPTEALRAGAAALAAWAAARKEELKVVAQRRDADGPMVDRALELVRAFVVERGLILFGGLAIHYALQLVGKRLYPDGERPDFDVLSPRSVDDAYDLADRLRAAGFEGVGAVRGIHVQTMRVRTDYVWVADIGYVPPPVFAGLPTLDYRGMRVLHPDFQRMDQLLAFCFPFSNAPHEDIFHRWRKDLQRFNLYAEHYPIAAGPAPEPAPPRPLLRAAARAAVPLVGRGPDLAVALCGFAAYAALRHALDELAAALTPGRAADTTAPRLALAFPSEAELEVETPVDAAVVVAGPDPGRAVAGLPGARWYDPYLDLAPESVRAGGLAVLSTRGRLLGVAVLSAAPHARYALPPGGHQVLVATPQYLLLHLLLEAHRAGDPGARAAYRDYYAHTLAILRAAEGVYAEALSAAGPAERGALMDHFAASPFAPSVRTLGTANHDAAYLIKMAAYAERARDTPPPALGLPPDLAELLDGLPQNYYPETAERRPAFDYGRNVFFRRAGEPRPAPS